MPDFREGGGPRPPYKESFLENIVGVSWQSSGAIFVSGDFCCFERAVRLERFDSEQNWAGLGAMAFDPGGGTFASSYAIAGGKPTFLLGGHRGSDGSGLVMVSHNGFDWETGHVFAGGPGRFVSCLVWDAEEKLFYVQLGAGSGIYTEYSPDGIFWFVSSTPFAQHCKLIPGVPDGVFGYDSRQDLLIFPGESSVPDIGDTFYRPNGLPYDATVIYIITNASAAAQTFAVTLNGSVKGDDGFSHDWEMTDHIAVAYSGGIWMVGGGGSVTGHEFTPMTVSSVDGGNSWFLSTWGEIGETNNDFFIETMIGAPIRDFRNQPVPKLATPAPTTQTLTLFDESLPVKTGKKRPPS